MKDFEQAFAKATDEWAVSQLGVIVNWNQEYFHYTNNEASNNIIKSQEFWASFIRSTSDPLEYALPLAEIRDWVCFGNELFENLRDPGWLFTHFNELVVNPAVPIRPYFISLTKEPSIHLQKKYGPVMLKFLEPRETNVEGIAIYLAPIIYCENVKDKILTLLRSWKNEVIEKVMGMFPNVDSREFRKHTFYLCMKAFSMIALSVKKKAFEQEKELRVVIFTSTPDSQTLWHRERKAFSSDTPIVNPRREYLPIILDALGVTVQKIS